MKIKNIILGLAIAGGCTPASPVDCPAGMSLAFTTDNTIYVCDDDEWDDIARMPAGLQYLPVNITRDTSDSVYIATRGAGLYKFDVKSEKLSRVSELQKSPVYSQTTESRLVYGMDTNQRYIAHRQSLLFWPQNGNAMPVESNFGRNDVISAVHSDDKNVYLGIGVNGLYVAENSGYGKPLRFRSLNAGLPYIPHDKRIRLMQEISALDTDEAGNVWAGISLETAVYRKGKSDSQFREVTISGLPDIAQDIYSISAHNGQFKAAARLGVIEGNTQGGVFRPWSAVMPKFPEKAFFMYSTSNEKSEKKFTLSAQVSSLPISADKKQRLEAASNKRLFYTSAHNYSRRTKAVQDMIKRGVYSGMVLDVKDDSGYIRYDSKVELARQIGAVRPMIDLKKIVQFMNEQKAWLVVRLVIFKDARLYNHSDFAILDSRTGQPWVGTPGERWVDAYNPRVADDYIVPLVKELQEFGVHEIQLDYIRFPSDGAIGRTRFRHQVEGMYYSEALASFLAKVRESTTLPISADIYGYHGIYRASGSIGQEFSSYARHLDIICPMLYSSHFGDLYLTDGPRDERAFRLLRHSARRYLAIADERILIRPWLQAFPMKNSIWGYGRDYFLAQIEGTSIGKNSGYTFWGSFDHMRTVEKVLQE
ncbi:MAG: hypothetical protein KDK38_00280 [Leptospiraceae bacterium]|nr:hypothetical protein [Leptospiraceae bacterium]